MGVLDDELGVLRASRGKLKKRNIPFDFVLERLATLRPRTRAMFGCTAVYVDEKIVFVLREKDSSQADNGVWIATTREHHESLLGEFPQMRSIAAFGTDVMGWQVIPAESPDFETAVERACELILSGDPRIGKVPKARAKAKSKKRPPAKKKKKR